MLTASPAPELIYSARLLDGWPALCLIAKRAYRLRGERLRLADDVPEIRIEPLRAPSINPGALPRLVEDTDLVAHLKAATDVIVRGSAWAVRGARRFVDTSVRIGSLERHVRTWGERTIEVAASGSPAFSEAAPFESMPITWDRAYGGCDAIAEGRSNMASRWARPAQSTADTSVYPRNPSGRGFVSQALAACLHGTLAPNLEDPARPLTPEAMLGAGADCERRPLPACYEPVDWLVLPRAEFVVPAAFGAPLPALLNALEFGTAPELPARDARAFSCAPDGLGGARLTGSERLQLTGLHPRVPVLELDLPGERPRMLLEPPGCGVHELTPLLQTVLLEPDEDRVTLTWAGTLEVAAPYPEEMCREMRRAVRWQ